MRHLSVQELDLVSGGEDAGEIVVTGTRELSDFDRMLLENYLVQASFVAGGDTAEISGGGDVSGPIEDFLEDDEAVFKALVKALIPGDPITKEVVASVITEIRNALIWMTSLETKAAMSDWFERNAQAIADKAFADYNNQTLGVSNPVEFMRGLFGQPNDPAPFNPN